MRQWGGIAVHLTATFDPSAALAAAALHEEGDAGVAVEGFDLALGVAGPVAAEEEVVAAEGNGVGGVAEEAGEGLAGEVVHVEDVGVGGGEAGLVDAEDRINFF